MKRDLDLVRLILKACEEHPHGFAPRTFELPDYSEEQIGYHIHLLGQAGLMRVIDSTIKGSS
jgi:hypothetical protein